MLTEAGEEEEKRQKERGSRPIKSKNIDVFTPLPPTSVAVNLAATRLRVQKMRAF
jgi:hypothetical protein